MLNTKRVTCAPIPVIFVLVSTGFSVGLIPTKYSLSSALWMSFYKENNSSHFICFHYFFLEKRIMIVIGMMGSSMHIFYMFSLFFSWKKDHDSYRHHGEFHAYLLYVFIIFFLGKKDHDSYRHDGEFHGRVFSSSFFDKKDEFSLHDYMQLDFNKCCTCGSRVFELSPKSQNL